MEKKKSGLDNPAFVPEFGDLENGNTNPTDAESAAPVERAQWGNGMEFLMSCIAMSVGLGNIWRFPFTAYENGGGAFLIPYIIVLIVIGRPLYYMEMGIGQFCSLGNVKMFEALAPGLKGVGYGQTLATVCAATYYCALMAITLVYLINSFNFDTLPWTICREEWEKQNAELNLTCVSSNDKNVGGLENSISSSELWFTREVLKEKTSIDDGVGLPDWKLTLCLLVSWSIVFLVSRKGIKSSGKAAYFLALFPYVIMFTLLIRAATLEGAWDGILYFINPDFEKLASADVWYAAVTQCFFSLTIGFGSIIMYSSYNNFNRNISRDAMIVATVDTFTSLLAGVTIFGILGNLAHELDVEVSDVINSGGSGLAFISYPEAIAKLQEVPWLFAILFFGMLYILGIGSLVGAQGTINTVITDAFPFLQSWHASLTTAIIGFLVGLVYLTPGGQFILNLVDFYGCTVVVFSLVIIEMTVIVWWYGLDNFCNDMEFMLKQKVGTFWRIMWGLITPTLLIIIFIYFLATIKRLQYGSYEYPDIALVCGGLIVAVAIIQVPTWPIYYSFRNEEKQFSKAFRKVFSSENWRPRNPIHFEEWKKFKAIREGRRNNQDRSWLKQKLDVLFDRYH